MIDDSSSIITQFFVKYTCNNVATNYKNSAKRREVLQLILFLNNRLLIYNFIIYVTNNIFRLVYRWGEGQHSHVKLYVYLKLDYKVGYEFRRILFLLFRFASVMLLLCYSMVKISHLDDASSEIFELEASLVEGQSLPQKDKKRRKRKGKFPMIPRSEGLAL